MGSTPVKLPSYVARHVNLGFDADDIDAFISAIDSSQNRDSSETATRLPQLPAELIIHIIHSVPVNYILDWRLVCRGFRDVIDTAVMFSYLPRVRLIGYIGATVRPEYMRYIRSVRDYQEVSAEVHEEVQFLQTEFHTMIETDASSQQRAKWSAATEACYRIDGSWFEKFEKLGGSVTDREQLPNELLRVLDLLELRENPWQPEADYGAVRWCIGLDQYVLDIDFPAPGPTWNSAPFFEADLRTRMIRVSWKDMIWQFLKTENSIRKKMERTQYAQYTFGHVEDCLRFIRRLRLRHSLDLSDARHRGCNWAIGTLDPLFHKQRISKAGHPWDVLELIEDDSARVLMQLRREASLTSAQRKYLLQLESDRRAMDQEGVAVNKLFENWRNNVYYPTERFTSSRQYQTTLPPNPFTWSDAFCRAVELELSRWRVQRKGIAQMKAFMESMNEVMEAPDGMFDDSGSDI